MHKIPRSQIIKYIKDNIEISEIIQEHIKLNKNGQLWKGLCPFHQEKTPSFVVNNQRQTFHCFGCGEHGDIFEFIGKITGQDLNAVIQQLSMKLGVVIDNDNKYEKKEVYDEYHEILNTTARFFINSLKYNEEALEYLHNRHLNPSLQETFLIGFAPNDQTLISYLNKQKFSIKKLLELGIVISKNNRLYSYFYNRIIFPILNEKNQIIGFSGRVIDNQQQPKYLNSKENILFQKSNLLYGMNLLPKKCNEIFITEGFLDVISLHSIGKHAVATMGTSFNEWHFNFLIKKTNILYIFFDNDEAGFKATNRIINQTILPHLNANLSIKIIIHKTNLKDPHEIIYNSSNIYKVINESQSLSEYLWNSLEKKDFNTPEEISKFKYQYIKLSKIIKDQVLQEQYLNFFNSKVNNILYNKKSFKNKKTFIKKQISHDIKDLIMKKALISFPELFDSELFDHSLIKSQQDKLSKMSTQEINDILKNKILPDLSNKDKAIQVIKKILNQLNDS